MLSRRIVGLARRAFSTLVVPDPSKNLSDLKPLLNAARKLKQDITVLSLGCKQEAGLQLLGSQFASAGIKEVFSAQDDRFGDLDYETSSEFLSGFLAKHKYDNVVMGNSSMAKEILPRLAVPFNSQPVTDVTEIESPDTFKRPMYAGNAIATVQSPAKVKFIGIRLTNFQGDLAPATSAQAPKVTELKANDYLPADFAPKLTILGNEIVKSERPELTKARVVVSGGRALKSAENFQMMYRLAEKFKNCAVGASRAAVDAGYAPNDLQVGQTGKIVAPDLYMSFGISGAIQHVAGIKDAKVIVAVDANPEAPIFQVADYGLVGDLFKIIPELEQKL